MYVDICGALTADLVEPLRLTQGFNVRLANQFDSP